MEQDNEKAIVTVFCDLMDGWLTGSFKVIVRNYKGEEIYRKVFSSSACEKSEKMTLSAMYIKKHFVKNTRFIRISMALKVPINHFEYKGLDTTLLGKPLELSGEVIPEHSPLAKSSPWP